MAVDSAVETVSARSFLLSPPQAIAPISNIDINFNAPVTINARNRADAERSMDDLGWGINAATRKRGVG